MWVYVQLNSKVNSKDEGCLDSNVNKFCLSLVYFILILSLSDAEFGFFSVLCTFSSSSSLLFSFFLNLKTLNSFLFLSLYLPLLLSFWILDNMIFHGNCCQVCVLCVMKCFWTSIILFFANSWSGFSLKGQAFAVHGHRILKGYLLF